MNDRPVEGPAEKAEEAEESRGGGAASSLVAAGILLSRISGLVRERVFAQFFGLTLYADVFRASLRMPNALQNLLGEGTLSASFIPVYSELLEQGREEEAGRVAGAIFSLLLALAGALTLIGVLAAPVLVSVFLPGFEGEKRELTIAATRIIFPMTGTLVLSAWALGILNSHRHFFVPYVAPVLWNAAMIATLLVFGGEMELGSLVIALAWGALAGGVLQLAVQLPSVIRLERSLKISWNTRLQGVREAVSNAGPAILGRGVVQISGYIDFFLASLLASGAVAAIGYAQTLYLLPVSLFGMSVAAAELPELSRRRTGEMEVLRLRTRTALERIAFYVVPSIIGYLLLGDVIVAALYQTGEFDQIDTLVVYLTLAAFSLGLLASTSTRLFSSTFFALRDTRTPAKFAAIRVAAAALFGFVLMSQFEPIQDLGLGPGLFAGVTLGQGDEVRRLGAVGLALGSGIAAWLEWGLLKRALNRRIGRVTPGWARIAQMFGAALAAAGAGWAARWALEQAGVDLHPILLAVAVFIPYGIVYFGVAALLGLPQIEGVRTRLEGVLRRFR